jgi:hypothetical protein
LVALRLQSVNGFVIGLPPSNQLRPSSAETWMSQVFLVRTSAEPMTSSPVTGLRAIWGVVWARPGSGFWVTCTAAVTAGSSSSPSWAPRPVPALKAATTVPSASHAPRARRFLPIM